MKDRKKNTIIRIKGLTKRYDTVLAVDNLSLNIGKERFSACWVPRRRENHDDP